MIFQHWRNITEWLEDAGYKAQSAFESESSDGKPIKVLIKKANIILENNQLVIDFNLRVVVLHLQKIQ